MSHGGHIRDPTGLGWWSGHTLWGKSNAFLSFFTAHRTCSGSLGTLPIGRTFSCEYKHLHWSQQLVSPRPQKQMIQDLIAAMKTLQTSGQKILLMMDSNAQIHKDQDLQFLQTKCNLHNLHQTNPAPSTYIGSDAQCIDHMFRCLQLLKFVTCLGSLSYLDGPQSDQKGTLCRHQSKHNFRTTFDQPRELPPILTIPQINKSRTGWSLSQSHAQVLRWSQDGQVNPEAAWLT